jgi:arsenate reductase
MQKIGVVFVSRRCSLRSILAEACLMHLAAQRFSAHACGQPGRVADAIHPAALAALDSAGIAAPTAPLRSWDELSRMGGPRLELVILLDPAMEALQPRWQGQPDTALWSYPDVAAVGADEEAHRAAIQTLYSLRRRLELLVNLPLHGLDRAAVRSDVRDLGHMY